MTRSIMRVHRELEKEAEIRDIRAEWPVLKQKVADLEQDLAQLRRVSAQAVQELQQAATYLRQRVSTIDYRGPLGWWRRRRDRLDAAAVDLAARKLAAKTEADQRRTEAARERKVQEVLARGFCFLFGYEWGPVPTVSGEVDHGPAQPPPEKAA